MKRGYKIFIVFAMIHSFDTKNKMIKNDIISKVLKISFIYTRHVWLFCEKYQRKLNIIKTSKKIDVFSNYLIFISKC